MAKLTSYTLNSAPSDGNYDITLTFDDSTTYTDKIHFGVLVDDEATGLSAQAQLDQIVADYATAYQQGLATVSATQGSVTVGSPVEID